VRLALHNLGSVGMYEGTFVKHRCTWKGVAAFRAVGINLRWHEPCAISPWQSGRTTRSPKRRERKGGPRGKPALLREQGDHWNLAGRYCGRERDMNQADWGVPGLARRGIRHFRMVGHTPGLVSPDKASSDRSRDG